MGWNFTSTVAQFFVGAVSVLLKVVDREPERMFWYCIVVVGLGS